MSYPAASPFKPSPLSFPSSPSASPRTSPFKRQNSTASNRSQSPGAARPSTPTGSGAPSGPVSNRPSTPSKLAAASTPSSDAATFAPRTSPTKSSTFPSLRPTSAAAPPRSAAAAASRPAGPDALSRVPPPLLHSLRESFALLDSGGRGALALPDVAAMHTQLSLAAPSQAAYFPAGAHSPLTLPAYLNGLAGPLARLSPKDELLAALAAFDEDESGQVGVAELLEAVCSGAEGLGQGEAEEVLAGFTGRRAFGKRGGGGGEVFRYREWVAGLGAGAGGEEAKA